MDGNFYCVLMKLSDGRFRSPVYPLDHDYTGFWVDTGDRRFFAFDYEQACEIRNLCNQSEHFWYMRDFKGAVHDVVTLECAIDAYRAGA